MNPTVLDDLQIEEIRKLAETKRRSLGFIGETPLANDIFVILENLDIILLEYPIESANERPAFSAALIYSEDGDEKLGFLGLNTADYYDNQIFAIAHELYHYFTKSESHLSRLQEELSDPVESKANRFAAEFLLPEYVLKRIILHDFKIPSLETIQLKTILRFIARLHCTWWLPYRSLVRRLYEAKAINSAQFDLLYSINERDEESDYYRTGLATDKYIFSKLNQPTRNIGTSPERIETIIRNFEDDLIDEDQLTEILSLFNKTPGEFGYEVEICEDDLSELDTLFRQGDYQ